MNLSLLMPEFTALGVLLALLVGEMFCKDFSSRLSAKVSLAGCFLVLAVIILNAKARGTAFDGVFTVTPLAIFFKVFFVTALMPVILMAQEFFPAKVKHPGELFLILWCTLIGSFFLSSANDLLVLFIALEIVTLSFYIMAAYIRKELISIESGLKYLIIGSLASAFLIYGISLLYVATGTTSIDGVRLAVAAAPGSALFKLCLVFVLAGIGFKVASVPFQLWVPDVYEGAPSPVVAYLSTGSKAAGFVLALRLLFSVFPSLEHERTLLISLLAALTILYGNLGALMQGNIKRLFGYSSIGHAGYILIGIAAGGVEGVRAVLFYILAYGLTNLAAFYVITLVGKTLKSDRIESYRGLSHRSPFLAAIMFLALLSLAGVPPLAGFFGKFLVLLAAVNHDLKWLALVGALAVAISLFYYLSLVRKMYLEESVQTSPILVPLPARITLGILAAAIILVGLFQGPALSFAAWAAQSLF
ncbi:MAG TPA: NADH-quinone oxidoreductase subunit N [Verrucomicrobiae bacterium]|jgi:NADH-quinone oxidoreductase subunit N|nr:NADH-quinone oxidoreductase subunit N [Verrucomicrobiae bacterium]